MLCQFLEPVLCHHIYDDDYRVKYSKIRKLLRYCNFPHTHYLPSTFKGTIFKPSRAGRLAKWDMCLQQSRKVFDMEYLWGSIESKYSKIVKALVCFSSNIASNWMNSTSRGSALSHFGSLWLADSLWGLRPTPPGCGGPGPARPPAVCWDTELLPHISPLANKSYPLNPRKTFPTSRDDSIYWLGKPRSNVQGSIELLIMEIWNYWSGRIQITDQGSHELLTREVSKYLLMNPQTTLPWSLEPPINEPWKKLWIKIHEFRACARKIESCRRTRFKIGYQYTPGRWRQVSDFAFCRKN